MTSVVTQQTTQTSRPNKIKQQKISDKINEALTKSDFEIAEAAYKKCLEDCKNSEDYRKFAAGPPKKVMMMNPRRRRERNRTRMISYKRAKSNYEKCVRQCNDDWYMAIVGLLGQENQDLNADVLGKIFKMLEEKKKSVKKKGGRKTRRKTRRKAKRKAKRKTRRKKSRRRTRVKSGGQTGCITTDDCPSESLEAGNHWKCEEKEHDDGKFCYQEETKSRDDYEVPRRRRHPFQFIL